MLSDNGDLITETCRRHRDCTFVYMVCAYVGSVNNAQCHFNELTMSKISMQC